MNNTEYKSDPSQTNQHKHCVQANTDAPDMLAWPGLSVGVAMARP